MSFTTRLSFKNSSLAVFLKWTFSVVCYASETVAVATCLTLLYQGLASLLRICCVPITLA